MVQDYKELQVWQRGMDLVEKIYLVTNEFPQSEKFGLVSQMRRAVVSIPSNIAEGSVRSSAKDYANFVSMAMGSCAELETQTLLAKRLGYLNSEAPIISDITPLRKMLWSLRHKLLATSTKKL